MFPWAMGYSSSLQRQQDVVELHCSDSKNSSHRILPSSTSINLGNSSCRNSENRHKVILRRILLPKPPAIGFSVDTLDLPDPCKRFQDSNGPWIWNDPPRHESLPCHKPGIDDPIDWCAGSTPLPTALQTCPHREGTHGQIVRRRRYEKSFCSCISLHDLDLVTLGCLFCSYGLCRLRHIWRSTHPTTLCPRVFASFRSIAALSCNLSETKCWRLTQCQATKKGPRSWRYGR